MKSKLTKWVALSVLVVVLLMFTKVLNMYQILENDQDAGSYHELAAWTYVLCGVILVFVAFHTYHWHILAGIIPFGLGMSTVVYGLFILWCKGVISL